MTVNAVEVGGDLVGPDGADGAQTRLGDGGREIFAVVVRVAYRVDDAYSDPRFNQAVDAETGFRTRSMLCLPLQDRSGVVFAVTQLLNRRDGRPFDEQDTRRYAVFASSLSVLLESLVKLGGAAAWRAP